MPAPAAGCQHPALIQFPCDVSETDDPACGALITVACATPAGYPGEPVSPSYTEDVLRQARQLYLVEIIRFPDARPASGIYAEVISWALIVFAFWCVMGV